MPNWTNNSITVRGTADEIQKFINDGVKNVAEKRVEDFDYSFNSWFPTPDTYRKYDTTNHPNGEGLRLGEHACFWDENSPIVTEELIEEYKKATREQYLDYGCIGWREWNTLNYGCKWDCGFNLKRASDNCVTFNVDTPWTAPLAFIAKLSRRYPELTISINSHYEDGYNEAFVFSNGDQEQIDLDYIQSEIYDYGLKKINELPDAEERVLMTKCLDKYLADGYWYPDDSDYEKQYQNFLVHSEHLKKYFMA